MSGNESGENRRQLERAERLAAELRANLKKRKDQARARKDARGEAPPPGRGDDLDRKT